VAANFRSKLEPEVKVRVRSLPLTVIPSEEEEDVPDPAVSWGAAQPRLPAGRPVAVVGGGAVPPPLEPPPEVPPALEDGGVEAEELPEADVPDDEPPHPAIMRAVAIAPILVIVIGSAIANNPLVLELNVSGTNVEQGGGNSRLR
jgi:hypothetical protein